MQSDPVTQEYYSRMWQQSHRGLVTSQQALLSLPYLHKLNEENRENLYMLATVVGVAVCTALISVSWWLRRRQQKGNTIAIQYILKSMGLTEDEGGNS